MSRTTATDTLMRFPGPGLQMWIQSKVCHKKIVIKKNEVLKKRMGCLVKKKRKKGRERKGRKRKLTILLKKPRLANITKTTTNQPTKQKTGKVKFSEGKKKKTPLNLCSC